MQNPHRVRALWSFIGIGIAILLTVVFAVARKSLSPGLDSVVTLTLIVAAIVGYFSGVAAMCRLKGIAVWQGILIVLFLMGSSSLVRVLYKPAQFVVLLLMAAFPLYLSRLPDVPADVPTPRQIR